MKLRNWHWGDQLDVQSLSNVLDLGVLMFCDQLQDGGRECLYNIGGQREDFPYWIALWWDEPRHFRLAQLSYTGGATAAISNVHAAVFTSFWSAADLPPMLLAHYRACNRLAN